MFNTQEEKCAHNAPLFSHCVCVYASVLFVINKRRLAAKLFSLLVFKSKRKISSFYIFIQRCWRPNTLAVTRCRQICARNVTKVLKMKKHTSREQRNKQHTKHPRNTTDYYYYYTLIK